MRDLLILTAAAFALIGGVPATAQTPDGMTPAEEQDCDVLIGATPGLYGLCVAFCEAHDAGFLWPSGDPAELDVPDQKILENYNTKKTASDPAMPCVPVVAQATCPCWSADELLEVLPPETNIDVNMLHACENSDNSVVLENLENGRFAPPLIQLATGTNSDASYCLVVNMDYPNMDNPGGPSHTRDIVLGTEQLQICKSLLADRALARTSGGDAWDCFD